MKLPTTVVNSVTSLRNPIRNAKQEGPVLGGEKVWTAQI